jgi:predicted CoA-substrate-specific enzyme activase
MNGYALGIDMGSTSVKISLLDNEKHQIYHADTDHHGRPYETLAEELTALAGLFDIKEVRWGALVGVGGAKLAQLAGAENYSEVMTQAEAVKVFYPQVRTIIELGCQNAKCIFLDEDGTVKHFVMNTDCSAGTGSFLEEQALRLGIQLSELSGLTEKAVFVPRIAGRCSVFAKTDIIHLQQEGSSVNDILLGLCFAVIRTFKAGVVRSNKITTPLLLHGGMTRNQGIIRAMGEVFSVKQSDFVIPLECRNVNSTGAALLAMQALHKLDLQKLIGALEQKQTETLSFSHEPLVLGRPVCAESLHQIYPAADTCYLGIDVGSTSTNLALMDEAGQVLDFQYLRTRGNPLAAVRDGLQKLREHHAGKQVLGVGVTGSGRFLISDFVGGDVVKDEITAQARAAVEVDPEVDTVFEIGGQDSKFIRLENGVVTDFEMNKVCAAGTGSFLEEQAKKLGVPVEDIARLALESAKPLSLGERCTVYMETNVRHHVAQGAPLEDILAGLCYSVAHNYLNRVVAGKKTGRKIVFQGGVAFNHGVLAALQNITGQEITVPPFFSVSGAWGAALLARETMQKTQARSNFLGWDAQLDGCEVANIACQGCANVCQVKKVSFRPGYAKYYGARCEIFEKGGNKKTEEQLPPLFALREQLFMKDYRTDRQPEAPTVGIPRILFMYKMFPMFQAMFHQLGFNVVISDDTDERIVALSESHTFEETCYPVKLITGHVLDLMEKNVDYIFLPSLATMKHPVSKTRQDYPCIFMQNVSGIIEVLLGSKMREKKITFLNPVLSFKFGRKYMLKTFMEMGIRLGKSPAQILPAIKKGFMAKDAFEQALEKAGTRYLQDLPEDEKVLVLITRPYGMIDRQLNMRIPQQLNKMGIHVVPKDVLPINNYDISGFLDNMYWPFGQHILSAVQITKERPNLYPVFLTNHGCGPDTALTHYVAEIMGDKPYLHLEVDEHTSPVGIITRLEAFVNSLQNHQPTQQSAALPELVLPVKPNQEKEQLIPDIGPHSGILAGTLRQFGYDARLLDPPQESAINAGRSFTITKEYFSLTALLGSAVETLKKESNLADKEIFVPVLEGAEVDGQYAPLLKTVLQNNGLSQVTVVAPYLEDMLSEKSPLGVAFGLTLFKRLLAADVLLGLLLETRPYLANPAEANQLYQEYLARIPFTEDLQQLLAKAKRAFGKLPATPQKRPVLAVVGEPYLLYHPALNADLAHRIEQLGAQVMVPPLTEILFHYLVEKQAEARQKKEFFNYLKYKAALKKILQEAETVLPGAGEALRNQAESIVEHSRKYLAYLSGGFGSYRIGKGLVAGRQGAHGIIHLASLYENTALLVNLLSDRIRMEEGTDWLNLGIDGKKNENDEIRLQTFIQTVKQKKDSVSKIIQIKETVYTESPFRTAGGGK